MVAFQKLIDVAVKEAEKSLHPRYRVGAVIYRRKAVLGRACNKLYTRARNLHPRYTRRPTSDGSIHAEVGAILGAKTNLRGAEALVVRINRIGELRLARPCSHCQLYLENVGIKRVVFSTSKGNFDELMLRERRVA